MNFFCKPNIKSICLIPTVPNGILEGMSITLPSAACLTSLISKKDLVVDCGSNVTTGKDATADG